MYFICSAALHQRKSTNKLERKITNTYVPHLLGRSYTEIKKKVLNIKITYSFSKQQEQTIPQ